MECSINWPNFIVRLSLICEILNNMCVVILCEPGCVVINFEINLIFLIKPFFLHSQKVKTKNKYLENQKSFFHHFCRAIIEVNKKKWKVRVWLMSMTYDLWVWEHLTESEQKYLHWNNLERNKKFFKKIKDIGNARSYLHKKYFDFVLECIFG